MSEKPLPHIWEIDRHLDALPEISVNLISHTTQDIIKRFSSLLYSFEVLTRIAGTCKRASANGDRKQVIKTILRRVVSA